MSTETIEVSAKNTDGTPETVAVTATNVVEQPDVRDLGWFERRKAKKTAKKAAKIAYRRKVRLEAKHSLSVRLIKLVFLQIPLWVNRPGTVPVHVPGAAAKKADEAIVAKLTEAPAPEETAPEATTKPRLYKRVAEWLANRRDVQDADETVPPETPEAVVVEAVAEEVETETVETAEAAPKKRLYERVARWLFTTRKRQPVTVAPEEAIVAEVEPEVHLDDADLAIEANAPTEPVQAPVVAQAEPEVRLDDAAMAVEMAAAAEQDILQATTVLAVDPAAQTWAAETDAVEQAMNELRQVLLTASPGLVIEGKVVADEAAAETETTSEVKGDEPEATVDVVAEDEAEGVKPEAEASTEPVEPQDDAMLARAKADAAIIREDVEDSLINALVMALESGKPFIGVQTSILFFEESDEPADETVETEANTEDKAEQAEDEVKAEDTQPAETASDTAKAEEEIAPAQEQQPTPAAVQEAPKTAVKPAFGKLPDLDDRFKLKFEPAKQPVLLDIYAGLSQ